MSFENVYESKNCGFHSINQVIWQNGLGLGMLGPTVRGPICLKPAEEKRDQKLAEDEKVSNLSSLARSHPLGGGGARKGCL